MSTAVRYPPTGAPADPNTAATFIACSHIQVVYAGVNLTTPDACAQPERYRAGVISGAPLIPIPEMLDPDRSFDLDPGWLSNDPFYLDSLENDPLAFVDADGAPLARELDKAWDRFGAELPKLAVPTLAVHGVNDPIAPIGAVRAYAEQIDPLQLTEFPGGRHDILNDTVHREVADAIVNFVDKHAVG